MRDPAQTTPERGNTMEWSEVLKLYGPMALGWICFGFLGKWHLDRYDKLVDILVRNALVIEALTNAIKDNNHHA